LTEFNVPDFLIIGAAKSGTTAMFEYMQENPEVFLTDPKEPHYYALAGTTPAFTGPGDAESINRWSVTERGAYSALYASASSGQTMGEASVSTLYLPGAAERLAEEAPDAKLICVLRDPADRAFSGYSFMRTRTWEPLDEFAAALADEERRIAAGWHHIWHYASMGFYGRQLERFLAVFPQDQLLVLNHEFLRSDPSACMARVYDFIGVRPCGISRTPAPHRSGEPRSRALSKVITTHHPLKKLVAPLIPISARARLRNAVQKRNVVKQSYPDEVRAVLIERFVADMELLESLTDIDTESWRRVDRNSKEDS